MPPVDLPATLARVLSPGHFFLASAAQLRVERRHQEQRRWETYLGHLLDPAFARSEETFEAWHVFVDDAEPTEVPLLSILWNLERQQVFVTRQILTHAFEAFEEAPGVILTRPTQKWLSELVGTIELASASGAEIEHDLTRLVLLAIVGTSRLPITSLESPLPDFSLGRLAYRECTESPDLVSKDPIAWFEAALRGDHSQEAQSRSLETALRNGGIAAVPQIVQILEDAAQLPDHGAAWARGLIRKLFNSAALSPYTSFVETFVLLVERLAERTWFGPQAALATLSYMLRHLCRHLTAFDLTLFHNFGANYPDALFLDTLLRAYLNLLTANPELGLAAEGKWLRRALRQGCLMRRQYEGHRVPDSPTSMGENARVLPPPFARVPDAQIRDSSQRKRRLFADTPTDALLSDSTRRMLQLSIDELDDPCELQELGTATFLDRPLGALKSPGAVDRTSLVSYEAYSQFIAIRRLATLKSARWIDLARQELLRSALAKIGVAGIPAAELSARDRPGVVSLTDANKAAADFVFVRTTRGSLNSLLAQFDWQALEASFPTAVRWLREGADVVLIQHTPSESPRRSLLRFYAGTQLQLELGFPSGQNTGDNYRERVGQEVVSRLQVLRILGEGGKLVELAESSIWIEADFGRQSVIHSSEA
jgi:hypothetical protein